MEARLTNPTQELRVMCQTMESILRLHRAQQLSMSELHRLCMACTPRSEQQDRYIITLGMKVVFLVDLRQTWDQETHVACFRDLESRDGFEKRLIV